jgi:hypothetical protein
MLEQCSIFWTLMMVKVEFEKFGADMNKGFGYAFGGVVLATQLALYYKLIKAIKEIDKLHSVICYSMYREIQKEVDYEFDEITSHLDIDPE